MDSIFNKDAGIPAAPIAGNGDARASGASIAGNGDATPAAAPPASAPIALSPAAQKFISCRWRKPAEDGNPDHCTHRDVLPMAGMTGFVPDSWCSDCSFFKAKRSPRKRQEEERQDWRW